MTDPVKIIVGEGDITEVNVPEYNLIQTGGGGGGGGSDGATFFPEVSQEGVISWTNDGGYDNPEPVNIKGPAGDDGEDGHNGVTFTPSVSDAGIISWTNDGDLPNPSPVNIKGSDGEDGEDGVSPTVTFTDITGGHTMTVTDKDHPSGQSINIMDGSGGGGTSDYDDLTNKPSINNVELIGNKTASDLGLASASDIPEVPVQSVNGKTGVVVLSASDVGAYVKPATGIPKTDLSSAVQTSLDKADTALQAVPPTYRTATAQDTIDAAQDAKIETIAGSLAMIESSPATTAHVVGEYIVYNGQLYKVTAAIASGQTLTPGTNITAAKIADDFADSQQVYPPVTITYGSRSFVRYSKKAGIVSVFINYFASDGTLSTQWSYKDIARMPEGFRPSVDQIVLGFSSTTSSLGTTLMVYPSGIVRVNCRQATLADTNDSVGATIVYPIA